MKTDHATLILELLSHTILGALLIGQKDFDEAASQFVIVQDLAHSLARLCYERAAND